MNKRPRLCKDQIEQLKIYYTKLREARGEYRSVEDDISDDDFAGLTVIYGHIEKLGGGCPYKAAEVHIRAIKSVRNAVRDTGGANVSKALQ